jgi:hypothetical protein
MHHTFRVISKFFLCKTKYISNSTICSQKYNKALKFAMDVQQIRFIHSVLALCVKIETCWFWNDILLNAFNNQFTSRNSKLLTKSQ